MPVAIEAGPELDRAVAKALGWRRTIAVGPSVSVQAACGFLCNAEPEYVETGADDPRVPDKVIPKYSTDLNAAFAAAERVGLFDEYQIGKWNPREYCVILSCDQPDERDIIGRAETPALAICAALLKLKETDVTSTTRD